MIKKIGWSDVYPALVTQFNPNFGHDIDAT